MELEQVVGCRDQARFGPDGGSASSVEPVEAPVELGIGEHRLDELLSLSVELVSAVGVQDAAHERVEATVPARPGSLAATGVRRDEDLGAVGDDALHLVL